MFVEKYTLKKETVVPVDDLFFNSPENVYKLATKTLNLLEAAEEYVYLITLNNKNKLTGLFEVSHGTVNSSILSPREIYIRALLSGATNIIIFHNHPSGDPEPSKDDILVTKRIKAAGELLGVGLLDHIIVGNYYYSFREEQMF